MPDTESLHGLDRQENQRGYRANGQCGSGPQKALFLGSGLTGGKSDGTCEGDPAIHAARGMDEAAFRLAAAGHL